MNNVLTYSVVAARRSTPTHLKRRDDAWQFLHQYLHMVALAGFLSEHDFSDSKAQAFCFDLRSVATCDLAKRKTDAHGYCER
jgi:hypothetical protein